MTIQIINTGTSPNSGNGDSIRTAFNKVNSNFQSIDGFISQISTSLSFATTGTLTVSENVIPSANLTYDLGSAELQWRSLYVGTSTIYLGGTALSIVDGNLTVGGNPVAATGTTVLPYLDLTNQPLIVAPAQLSSATTFINPGRGNNASFDVVIDQAGLIESVTVNQAGSGYVPNQRYLIPSFFVGAPSDQGQILLTVQSTGTNGQILSITNVSYTGTGGNTPGTYTNVTAVYQPSFFDEIDQGIRLARGNNGGLFNADSEQQYDNFTHTSPAGTLWNSDGWGNLNDLRSRSWDTLRSVLNNAIGDNIVGAELIMHDTINDKFYKFEFTEWGQNNGGSVTYNRYLITDPNYFAKADYGDQIDIFVQDDGQGSGIGITRGTNQGIYNPYREESWDSDISPDGTLWNRDGWDDLTNLVDRSYMTFYDTFNGALGLQIPGSKTVMYIPETQEYWAIQWLTWTQGGNGGGFSYNRYLIDVEKIKQGITFADGTNLSSAAGLGRVKSTASGNRRIEQVAGSNSVTVTARTVTNLTTVTSRASTASNQVYISRIDNPVFEITDNYSDYGIAEVEDMQFSIDNINWYSWAGSATLPQDEYGYDLLGNPSLTYNQGDTVYFRYTSGGNPVVWWNKSHLPGGSLNFRGAVIDYHAYTGEATFIGTIHIVDDSGEEHITHTEVSSGSSDSGNDDLWVVQNEGTISYRRLDGESKTLKVHWNATVFYGSEYYD